MGDRLSVSASILLDHYSFDLNGFNIEQLVQSWLGVYPRKWIVTAIVEAIYQGRYKAASVEKILFLWHVRGRRKSNFDVEFADLVCRILLRDRRSNSKHIRRKKQKVSLE